MDGKGKGGGRKGGGGKNRKPQEGAPALHDLLSGEASRPPEWTTTTTVMMRNLPNKYTQRMLLTEVNEAGFLGTFDFLYLPIDPETNANRGYCFINFVSPSSAWLFKMAYEGRAMNNFNSNKVVSVAPATLQGFEANYAHYASARVNRGDPAARPLFLRQPSQVEGNTWMGGGGSGGGRGRQRGKGQAMDEVPPYHVDALDGMDSWDGMAGAGAATYFGLGNGGYQAPAPYPDRGTPDAAAEASPADDDPPMHRFCPQCGGAIQPSFQFCPQCGFSLKGLFDSG